MQFGRTFSAFVLTSVIWVMVLRIPLTYAYYILDTQGFIEKLCENKDKPAMNCDGKCYLSKMWQADSEPEDKPMPVLVWSKYEFVPVPEALSLSESCEEDCALLPRYRNHYIFLSVREHFRPPPALS